MSTLLIIWIVSALTLLSIVIYARKCAAVRDITALQAEVRFSDVVTREITTLHRDFYKLLDAARPHGERSLSAGLVMVKRGQDLFISRVYGRIQSEKGRASSFFLKQIAEHKERDLERENSSRSM